MTPQIPLTPEEQAARDADKLWGLSKLYDAQGRFRWGKVIVDGLGHLGLAFGCALPPAGLLAYFAGWGAIACGGIGLGVGVFGVALREVVQWIDSGSPHLVDRLADLVPAPFGGTVGGIAAWWVVSRYLL